MYEVALTEAYFPAQKDIDVREITVGGLLRETAARRAEAEARSGGSHLRGTVARALSHWFRAKASGGDPTCMSL